MATSKRFVAKNGLDNNNLTITNVANPVNAQDVSTRGFSSDAANLNTGTLLAARFPAFTGDITTVSGAIATTLSTTGVSAGAYGSASSVATYTVDAKGRLTVAGSTAIAIAQSAVTNLTTDLGLKANIASPTFTGIPAAPTATALNNTTQLATTAFVTTAGNLKANLASPTFTGTPAAPTATAGTTTTQIATTAFVSTAVDAARQGLTVKNSVRAATTANITLSGAQTIDGIGVVAGDRILVKDQTTASANGIYVVAAGSWTRSTDFDESSDILNGAFTFVEEGAIHADSGWVMTTDGAITIGTTALAFAQFSGAGAITAGAGLTKTGSSIDVGTASTARIVVNATNIDLAVTAIAAGTYRSLTVDTYGRATAGTNPTTLAGYAITDAQPLNASLTNIGGLAGTTGILRKTAAHTYTLDTATYLTAHPAITSAANVSNTAVTYIQSMTFDSNGHVATVTSSAIREASTTVTGIVQLNNTVASTSTTLAATANSVKTAYDLANAAVSSTGNSLPVTQGDISSATLTTSAVTANQVAMSIPASTYRTAKFLVQVTSGSAYYTSELLAVHDGTTVYLTEYASIGSGADLSTFDADINGGNLRLLVTPANAVSTYKVIRQTINV